MNARPLSPEELAALLLPHRGKSRHHWVWWQKVLRDIGVWILVWFLTIAVLSWL